MKQGESLLQTIATTAYEEDVNLRKFGKSIFSVPERAFVYLVAKKIAFAAPSIFNIHKLKWDLEIDLGNGGPSDFVIEIPDEKDLVFEFKMGGHQDSYFSDIKKLQSLDPQTYKRYFCAVIDAYPNELPDVRRVLAIDNNSVSPTKRSMEHFPYFPTIRSDLVKELVCVVAMWELN